MKTTVKRRAQEDASVLVVTVCILVILTTMAVSYLLLLKNDNLFVVRDQAWNRALAIAEAGVEEAMAQINYLGYTPATPVYNANGWIANGTTYRVPAQRSVYGGSYDVSFLSNIVSNHYHVVITSTGMVTAPISAGQQIIRTIQVVAEKKTPFQMALMARRGFKMNGNNITVDSYDSSDIVHFPGGIWNAANRRAHGDIGTLTNSGDAFDIGNANIMGKLHTGTGGTYQQAAQNMGKNGSVGDVAWVMGGNSGIEQPYADWFSDDVNKDIPDISPPFSNNVPNLPTIISNKYTLSSGQYYFSNSLTLGNGESIVLPPDQNVEIYIAGDFTMKPGNPGGTIIIPATSKLKIYVGGANTDFYNVNNAGNANSFQYYGLAGNTSLTWSGNSGYTGTVYAPSASFTLNGGGSGAPVDFQGSAIVNNVVMNGKFNVHFDENLPFTGPPLVFVATSWAEL